RACIRQLGLSAVSSFSARFRKRRPSRTAHTKLHDFLARPGQSWGGRFQKRKPDRRAGLPTVTLSPESSSRESHPQEKWLSLARPGQQNGGHYEEHQISVRNRTQFALAF